MKTNARKKVNQAIRLAYEISNDARFKKWAQSVLNGDKKKESDAEIALHLWFSFYVAYGIMKSPAIFYTIKCSDKIEKRIENDIVKTFAAIYAITSFTLLSARKNKEAMKYADMSIKLAKLLTKEAKKMFDEE